MEGKEGRFDISMWSGWSWSYNTHHCEEWRVKKVDLTSICRAEAYEGRLAISVKSVGGSCQSTGHGFLCCLLLQI